MKALKNVFKILAIILTFGALALYFFDFAAVGLSTLGKAVGIKGIDLAFGGEIKANGEVLTAALAKSTFYLLSFLLTIFSAALAIFGIKKNGSSVASVIFSLLTGIMLTTYFAGGSQYVDTQGLRGVISVDMTKWAWIAVALVFAGAVFTVLGILAGDKAKVNEEGGKTLPKRVIRFVKDYIGEIKKITWPKVSAATKNTIVVIVISVVIGAFVWLLDLGLSYFIDWALK